MSNPKTSTDLREAVLSDLITRIKDGDTVVTKDGTEVRIGAPAGIITAAIGYLKQFPPEDVAVGSDDLSATLRTYAGKMPFARVAN